MGLYLVKGVNGCRCIMGTHTKFNKAYYSGNILCNSMELWISWNRTGNLISGKLIEWAIVGWVQCYSPDFKSPYGSNFPSGITLIQRLLWFVYLFFCQNIKRTVLPLLSEWFTTLLASCSVNKWIFSLSGCKGRKNVGVIRYHTMSLYVTDVVRQRTDTSNPSLERPQSGN